MAKPGESQGAPSPGQGEGGGAGRRAGVLAASSLLVVAVVCTAYVASQGSDATGAVEALATFPRDDASTRFMAIAL